MRLNLKKVGFSSLFVGNTARIADTRALAREPGQSPPPKNDYHVFLRKEIAHGREHKQAIAEFIDQEIRTIVTDIVDLAYDILEHTRDRLDALVVVIERDNAQEVEGSRKVLEREADNA